VSAPVDAGRLLAELNENWRLMGKQDSGGVLRACSMTLIVVAGEQEDPQSLGETLASIMHEHPNRTLVLRAGTGASVEARTSIQCWMPFGRRQQVCCEQIEISAPRSALDQVPPVLLGLMVADLPVAVWCRDARLAALPELAPVLRLAGKLIVDTSRTSRPEAVESLRALSHGHWKLADLAWTRISRWRQRLAQEISKGGTAGDACVTYSGSGEPMVAAYLSAWLQLAATTSPLIECEDPAQPAPGMGRLRSVRLGALELRRTAPTVVVTSRAEASSTAVFPLLSDANLLRDELGVFGRDPHFEAALAAVLTPGLHPPPESIN
jgi:glucose-6-phosphate dehydrogenase assembly protein OpcA